MLILKVIGLTVIFIAIAFLGLGIKIFFSKEGKFPETHVGHNKEMRKRKIYCIKTQDRMEQNLVKKERIEKRRQEKLILTSLINQSPKDFSNVSLNLNS
ncbi:MAG: hypothetical protein K9H64_01450 [Bacteroidales bacterium]|nr:hypothetical protein [Bacteroidales bacterium]MCF8454569.1 hypothetical protein [Bacteroidales bacterium]